MNTNTLNTIASVLGLINPALGIIGAFATSMGVGSDQVTKVTGAVQDAASVVTALTPLVTAFGNGQEVTPEDVRVALAGKDTALKAFDDLIAAKGG